MNVRARCTNPTHPHYENYGGRGILFNPEWNDFPTFLQDIESTIGPKPPLVEGYERYWSIDRINNDGNYEKSNIRWANPTEQRLNQRNAHSQRYFGKVTLS